MKKAIILFLVSGFSSFLWAASVSVPTVAPISVLTLTQVAQSTPTYVGQPVICSNCASVNGSLGTLCISTEATTAQNAFIIAGSSLTATTVCK